MNHRKHIYLLLTLLLIALCAMYCVQKHEPQAAVKKLFNKELAALQILVDREIEMLSTNASRQQVKAIFISARKQYKKIEFYFEYFFPTTAVMINGAPIDEIELGEDLVEAPTGFQVMEAIMEQEDNAANKQILLNEWKKMQVNLARAVRYNAEYTITPEQIFDACRLEIFRITGIGITGFDCPVILQSLPEASAALNGMQAAMQHFATDNALNKSFEAAIDQLNNATDFNSFNRLQFITDRLQPLSRQLDQLRKELHIQTVAGASALQDDATDLFQKNAFHLNKFVGNHTEFISPEKIQLGAALFNSTLLSNTGTKSCASCHQPGKAFTDGLRVAMGAREKKLLRNTPTLTYAGLQRGFFYDLKATTLEDQALDVVHNKDEMDGSLEMAAQRINQQAAFKKNFAGAFQDSSGQATPWRIQHALASYIRSLSPFSSRFDRYLQGEHSLLNEEEKNGFNLFMGKAKCGACHFAPVFNGTAPPLFQKSEGEVLGVPSTPDTANARIDQDPGRYGLNPYPQFRFAFKTPTLRNISKTAPYMHNGVYQTLEEVLDFYNRGGGHGIGIELDNQTLSADPLQLNKKELQDIIAFLRTLEDGGH